MNIYAYTNEALHLFLHMHVGMDLQDTNVGVNRCRPGKIVIACYCAIWHTQCVQTHTCGRVLKSKIKIYTFSSLPRRVMNPRVFFKHNYHLLKTFIKNLLIPVFGDFLNGNCCCVTLFTSPGRQA